MNRTIEERIRFMFFYVKLFKYCWGEVMKIVVYLINRLFSVFLDGDILERVWIGKKCFLRI